MPISRSKKEELIAGYVENLSDSSAVFFTTYTGLRVSQMEDLRGRLREQSSNYSIVKNTLMGLALQQAGISVPDDLLVGPVGVGFCKGDNTAVAKLLSEFSKESNELLTLKGGIMEGRFITGNQVKALASLPPQEVLRAGLVGLISTPASRLAGVVAGGVRQVVNVVNAYSEKDAQAAA